MDNVILARRLKAVIIGLGVLGAIVYVVVLPALGMDTVAWVPEFSYMFWPWLIFLWGSGIPCYLVLIYSWMVTENIQAGHTFTYGNARILKKISRFALFDTIYFLTVNVIYFFLGMNHPGILLMSLPVVLVGVVFTVVASAVSSFFYKASALQEQSDLTI